MLGHERDRQRNRSLWGLEAGDFALWRGLLSGWVCALMLQKTEMWEEGPSGELIILQNLLVPKETHVVSIVGESLCSFAADWGSP